MAANLKDLAEFDDPDLHLIYRKKKYTVKAASFSLGRFLHKVLQVGYKTAMAEHEGTQLSDADQAEAMELNDDEEADFIERCLGADLIAKIEADNVPYKVASLMAMTLLMDTTQSRDAAMAYWNAGGKAPAPKPEPKTGTPTRGAGATTTQKRNSVSGTKTPAKAKATPGETS